MMSHPIVIHLLVGTRPNFIKMAPLRHKLVKADWCRPVLVHTDQHYDRAMSEAFLLELGLRAPDVRLGVGSGSHAEQTAGVMVAYERLCLAAVPNWVVVVGDVNSTLGAALAAKKLGLPVAHLEAGLRSHDRSMPEEINRVLVDAIADLLWTPSADADANLGHEGVPAERIDRIGNILIDSYEMLRGRIATARTAEQIGLEPGSFGVVTLHRPHNVDEAGSLSELVQCLGTIAQRLPLVFPVHPRTRRRLERFDLWERLGAISRLTRMDPLGYIAFMSLVQDSRLVITDSGGLQEETTYLQIPCLTLRTTTERPITISEGTNRLVSRHDLLPQVDSVLHGTWPKGNRPELWDGRAADRAAATLHRLVAA